MICFGHEQYKAIVETTVNNLTLARKEYPFTSIVCSGTSGLIIAGPVAIQMGIPLVIIRRDISEDKPGNGHVWQYSAGAAPLFIDDHIAGGNTFSRCFHALHYPNRYQPEKSSGIKIAYVYEYNPMPWGRGNPPGMTVHPVAEHAKVVAMVPELSAPEPKAKVKRATKSAI